MRPLNHRISDKSFDFFHYNGLSSATVTWPSLLVYVCVQSRCTTVHPSGHAQYAVETFKLFLSEPEEACVILQGSRYAPQRVENSLPDKQEALDHISAQRTNGSVNHNVTSLILDQSQGLEASKPQSWAPLGIYDFILGCRGSVTWIWENAMQMEKAKANGPHNQRLMCGGGGGGWWLVQRKQPTSENWTTINHLTLSVNEGATPIQPLLTRWQLINRGWSRHFLVHWGTITPRSHYNRHHFSHCSQNGAATFGGQLWLPFRI